MTNQTERLIAYLWDNPNKDIPATKLHRIGSGKPRGYLGSLSRRISDLRSMGLDVVKSRDVRVNGQRHTAYRLIV